MAAAPGPLGNSEFEHSHPVAVCPCQFSPQPGPFPVRQRPRLRPVLSLVLSRSSFFGTRAALRRIGRACLLGRRLVWRLGGRVRRQAALLEELIAPLQRAATWAERIVRHAAVPHASPGAVPPPRRG